MKNYLLAIIIIPLSFLCQAQKIGLYAGVYNAHGEFNKNIDRNPVGININYLHTINERLNLGGEIGIAMYSNTTYDINYDGRPLEVFEEDCFWTFHALAQYTLHQTEQSYFYLEGRMGLTTFFSSITPYDDTETDFEGNFKTHGTAFNMGAGLGFNYDLWWGISFDALVGINGGTKTHYRNISEEIETLNDGDYLSLTHYTNYRIGLQYEF